MLKIFRQGECIRKNTISSFYLDLSMFRHYEASEASAMMLRRFNIGIIGYGNLGRAAVRLLNLKRRVFEEEGLDLVLTYVLGRRGGVLNLEGLDCETLLQNTAWSDTASTTASPLPPSTCRRPASRSGLFTGRGQHR